MVGSRWGVGVLMILVMALTFLVMTPGLKGTFFFDDNPNIVDNTAIHITTLNLETLKSSLGGASAGPLGRPVSMLSFAVTHYFFGLEPVAFKTINLCIHLLNGLLIFWLVKLLLQGMPSHPLARWMPLWVMTVWLVHPVNLMPVMLSVQRMTLLSALFMLLALISHIKAIMAHQQKRTILLLLSWLLFWPLSMLSKETGLLFPLYNMITVLFLQAGSNQKIEINTQIKKMLQFSMLCLLLIVMGMGVFLGYEWFESAYKMRSFSLIQRLMTEARVLWVYAGQIMLPKYNFFATYHDDFILSTSVIKPVTTLISIIAWVGVIVLIVAKWFRQPLICFSSGWFLVGHLMESTFLPLEIMHEHRNYLPSLGLILFSGYVGIVVCRKIIPVCRPIIVVTMALAPIIMLGFFTWMRASQLGNPLVGLQVEAAQHPQSARANYAAAIALFKAGRGDTTDQVMGETIKTLFERSGVVDPTFKLGYLGLIVWACASDREVEKSWIKELTYRLETQPFGPGEINLAKNLFDPLSSMPDCLNAEEIDAVFMAGGNNTKITTTQRALFFEYAGDYALFIFNDMEKAKTYLLKGLKVNPSSPLLNEKIKIIDGMSTDKGKK